MTDQGGGSDSTDRPTLARPGEAGWARAHVRIGEHYPLIAVRSLLPGVPPAPGPPPDSIERPATETVNLARYAMALAKALVSGRQPPRAVQVEAIRQRQAPDGAPVVVLRVTVDAPGVPQDVLEHLARSALVDGQQRGDLPSTAEVELVSGVQSHAIDRTLPSLPPVIRQPQMAIRLPRPVIQMPPLSIRLPRPVIRLPQMAIRLPRPVNQMPRLSVRLPRPVIRLPQMAIRLPRPVIQMPRLSIRLPRPTIRLPRLALRLPSLRITWPRLRLGFPHVSIRLPRVPLRIPRAVSASPGMRALTRVQVEPDDAAAWRFEVASRPPGGAAFAPLDASSVAPTRARRMFAGRRLSTHASSPGQPDPTRRSFARRRLLAGFSMLVAVGLAAFLLSPEFGRLAGIPRTASGTAGRPQAAPTPRPVATRVRPTEPPTAESGSVGESIPVGVAAPAEAPAGSTPAPVAPAGSTPAVGAGSTPAAASTPALAVQATSNPIGVAGLAVTRAPATASPSPLAPTGGRLVANGVPRPGSGAWPSDPSSTAWLAADGYHLFARQTQRFAAVGLVPQQQALVNVVVSATFHKTDGPAGGGYGIIVRDQGPPPRDGLNQGGRYYVLEVGDVGQVGIWRRENDHWDEIVGWTPSAAVHPGTAENTLLVRIAGDQLSLSVNGTEAAIGTDSALTNGGVGVFLGGDQNQAVLTDFGVQSND